MKTFRVWFSNKPSETHDADRVEVNSAGTLVLMRNLGESLLAGTVSVPFMWFAAGGWIACKEETK
jgi:hypothetical protein